MSKKDDKNTKRDREAFLADSPSYERFDALTEKLLKPSFFPLFSNLPEGKFSEVHIHHPA